MEEPKPHIILRVFYASLLGIFAFVPSYIVVGVFPSFIKESLSGSVVEYAILAFCITAAYVLWLLSWRALTWSTSRNDGGLLPPWSMKVLSSCFGVVGAVIVIFSIYMDEYYKIIPGVAYMVAASFVFTMQSKRVNKSNQQER